MPDGALALRGEAHGKLSAHLQQLILDPEFVKKVDAITDENLTDAEKGILRLLRKDIKELTKLPPSFVQEWSNVVNTS